MYIIGIEFLNMTQQDQLKVTGIDPNAFMFPYAREAADTAGLDPRTLTLTQGSLPWPSSHE